VVTNIKIDDRRDEKGSAKGKVDAVLMKRPQGLVS